MKNSELLDTYYSLYDIFEEIGVIADAMKDLGLTTKTRCSLIQHMEFTRLWNIESELNQLYDMPIKTLVAYRLRKDKIGQQTSIYDFLKDDENE
jgi:hypothetical protein